MKILLDRTQKIAFARILSDLIEADFIVEEGEMDFFERIISKDGLNISVSMLVEAKTMDMAKAVAILKELDGESRRQLMDVLRELSLSDGTCVPLEAIQIFALEQALEHDAFIFSVPAKDVGIDNMTVIYIENDSETVISKSVEQAFRSISNEFSLAGFDFVYIPYVVEDYKRMKPEYLQKVVRYMIPSISQERVDAICCDLQKMTTARFCRDLLYKIINIPLLDVKPSLLFKINESALIYKYDREDAERTEYANFLRIELKDDVLDEVRHLLDAYRDMLNCSVSVNSMPKSQKFMYYGFHRSLFDLIAYCREQKEYRLFFDMTGSRPNVYFEPLDGSGERIPLKLNPQETALYAMIVKESFAGNGLDWRDHPPKEVLAAYNEIYRRIGKGKTTTMYKDRTQVHRIKNRIRCLQCIANMDLFVPLHVRDGLSSFYKVKATSQNIIFIE